MLSAKIPAGATAMPGSKDTHRSCEALMFLGYLPLSRLLGWSEVTRLEMMRLEAVTLCLHSSLCHD